MYKYEHQLLPQVLDGMFIRNNHLHGYNTRHGNHYALLKYNRNIIM